MDRNEENVTPTLRALRADVFALKAPVMVDRLEAEALARLVDANGVAVSIQDLGPNDLPWITALVAGQASQNKRIKVAANSTFRHLRVSVTNKELLYLDGVSFDSDPYPTGTWLHIAIEIVGDPGSSATLELDNAIPQKILSELPPGVPSWTHYHIIKVA